jgi:hypothetical protein
MSAIASIPSSASIPTTQPTPLSYFKERRDDVQQLSNDLKAGDLSAAQQDYNNIVSLGNNVLHRDNPFLKSDRGQDFDAIGGALENGDLNGARQAFAALENTYKLPPVTLAATASVTAAGSENAVNVLA